MTAEKINIQALFSSLDETWSELLALVSSVNADVINKIPYKDSWTVAQLATHIKKSNKAIIQGLQMNGKPVERNPEERINELKKIFLNFEVKYQSPDFIVPEKQEYNKTAVAEQLQNSIGQLKELRNTTNLSEIISLPVFGEITKLEILHFVLYHTQRHMRQLKKICAALQKN